MFLVYFLPFIWLGNLILILVFNLTFQHWKVGPSNASIVLAAGAKFLFLFVISYIYFKLLIVPAAFLQTMGIFQFLTAIAGGAIASLVYGTINFRTKKVD
jgi:hypothetical protein